MITDALLRLAGTTAIPPVAQAVPTLTANATSTSVYYIDLQQNTNVSGGTQTVQNRDIGEGYPIQAVVTLATAASGTTNFLTFNVIVADDAVGTTNPIVIGSTGPIPVALMIAGAQFGINLNPQFNSLGKRYLMGQYVVGSAALVGATHFMDIVLDSADSKKFYAGGFVVS